MLYIIVAILIFGVLIATHELGHFATAKLLGVKVNEFSVGMGPAIWKKQRGDTLYSVRILPIGGYCAMEGEDDDSVDPRAFGKAASWKKMVILCAGAAMNFLTGLLLILILYVPQQAVLVETYGGSTPGYGTEECGLLPGDRFLSIDGHRILVYGNAQMYLERAGDTLDIVVERDGQTVRLDGLYLPRQERTDEEGVTTNRRGILVASEAAPLSGFGKVQYAWNGSPRPVRTCRHRGYHDGSGELGYVCLCGLLQPDLFCGPHRGQSRGHESSAAASVGRRESVFPVA